VSVVSIPLSTIDASRGKVHLDHDSSSTDRPVGEGR